MSFAFEMSKAVLDTTTTCTIWTVNILVSLSQFWLISVTKADTHGSTSQFAAQLGMQFKIPALLLEDVEHHIESIGCYPSKIHLYFKSARVLKRTYKEFTSVDSFFLITSHEGCNEDGERNPHM